jgi:hypothetical protein
VNKDLAKRLQASKPKIKKSKQSQTRKQ